MAKELILVVDDEADIVELITYNLQKQGYRTLAAGTGEAGLALARERHPDLMILDLMLPGALDGLEVCRRIRQDAAIASLPVIMVTAKSEEVDEIVGLEFGADDYVTKPFSPRILLARVKANLRRQQANAESETGESGTGGVIRRQSLVVNPVRHEVLLDGQAVELTVTEFRILQCLAAHPGRVYSRAQIIEAIHEDAYAVTDRAVDVQIVGLRRKLGEFGKNIETIRGVGYRFRDAE